MRSFSRKALAAAAVAVAGALAVGAGLAGASDSGTGDASSDVRLVQTDPSTTVPSENPDDGGDDRGRQCDHERDGSGQGDSSDGNTRTDVQASYRRGEVSSLRWG